MTKRVVTPEVYKEHASKQQMSEGILRFDICDESWREYRYADQVVRIENPIYLYLKKGGTTHRILGGDGVMYCVPAVGVQGCFLRWKPKDMERPVAF